MSAAVWAVGVALMAVGAVMWVAGSRRHRVDRELRALLRADRRRGDP